MKKIDVKHVPIKGDGNCLFHSLREALKDIRYTNQDVLGEIDFNKLYEQRSNQY